MKTLVLAAVLLSAATAAVAQVGVSVTVGQPGFYGRLDIGDYPAPQLIYAQPVIVQRPQYYSARPIYLRVPPGHAKNWSKHCRRYNACNQEVYFVQDSWYNNQYAPRYRQQHGDHGRPGGRPPQQHGRPDYGNHDHDHDRDRGHYDKHDDKHDDKRDKHEGKRDKHDDNPGRGHGNGNGNGRRD